MIRFIGCACRLPQANSVSEFAENLYTGHCAIREVPGDRWRADVIGHPLPGTKGKAYINAAGVVDGIENCDAKVFGISPREADHLDPQQRMFLQVVWEALEDACIPPADLAGQNVGVYVGASTMDYASRLTADAESADGYLMTGSALSVIANRISHVFDLRGPSMTVDTACSSSLFALESAMTALASGRIDMAIVGGTNALISPSYFVGFSEARMLSPTGLCQAFSENADGYVRGEGAVAFILKRDEPGTRPVRDYGRLVHVGLNTTGRVANIALPSTEAQLALLEKTYAASGIDADQLAFVEAHGTGTPVGDPIEAAALGHALGQRRTSPLPIGSVKSNIGHLEAAAGCAGLLKTLIALQRGQLPPSLNALPLNGAIPFADYNLAPASDAVALDLGDPRRRFAGVSAFGFGGANSHAIIEGPEPREAAEGAETPRQDRIFFTSTFCRDSLKASAATYRDRIFTDTGRPRDPLFGALTHFRGRHPHRLAIVATDQAATDAAFAAFAANEKHEAIVTAETGLTDSPPVFMFSGNGSQYPGMSRAAYDADAVYRARYDEIDAVWSGIAGWSLVEKIGAPELADQLGSADIAQPLLFADQVAMAAGLTANGVRPAAVVGHSGGEVAAAAVCGALTLAQAMSVLYARSTAQQELAGQGTMAALQVSEEEAQAALDDLPGTAVRIAAVNSPRSVSLSGPVDEIGEFIRHARRTLRWACVPLKVNFAFHHPIQDATEANFKARLGSVVAVESAIPFVSSVTGRTEMGDMLDVDYWWHNIRQPVRFRDAVSALANEGHRCFIEIGPDPVLVSYVRDTLKELPDPTSVTFSGARSDSVAVNPVTRAAGRALVNGAVIALDCLAPRPAQAVAGLATYPFQYESHGPLWSSTVRRQMGCAPDFHPLLGIEAWAEARMWSRDIDAHVEPVLADHVVSGRPIMPGTAFVEMAVAAAQRTLDTDRVELRDLDVVAPIPLQLRSMTEVRTSVAEPQHTVRISSRQRLSDEPWREHAACQVLRLPEHYRIDSQAPDPRRLEGDGHADYIYDMAAEIGLTYGPAFRRVSHYRRLDETTFEIILTPPPADHPPEYAIDLVAADAVFHGLVARVARGRFADQHLGFVPIRIARAAVTRPGQRIGSGRLSIRKVGNRSIEADFDYFSPDGEPVARFERVRFRAVRLEQEINFDRHAFTMSLERVPAPEIAPEPRIDLPTAAELAQQLEDHAGAVAEDELPLLLDAAAQRLAHDVLVGWRNPQGLLVPPGEMAPEARACLALLEELAAATDQGTRRADGFHLKEVSELPEVDHLLAGLLAERPDRVAECALLARLASALPALLAGDLAWDGEAVFGRAALENLRAGSVVGETRDRWLARAVAELAGAVPKVRRLRIGELYRGRRLVTGRLPRSLVTDLDLYVLNTASEVYAPYAASALRTTARPVIDLEDAAGAPALDLVVISTAALDQPLRHDVLAKCLAVLRPGGLLVMTEPAPRDHVDLIAAVAQPGGMEGPLAGIHEDPDAARAAVAEICDADLAFTPRIETAGGSTAIVIRKRETQESAASPVLAAAPASGADVADAITQAVAAALGTGGNRSLALHGQADLRILTPYRRQADGGADDPVLVIAPPHETGTAGAETLKARLMVLARLLAAAPDRDKPIWLIAPGGAGYRGAADPVAGQAAIWSFMRTAKNEYPALDLKCVDFAASPPDREALQLLSSLVAQGTPETEIVLAADGLHALRVQNGARNGMAPADTATPVRARLCDDPGGGLDNLSWRTSPLPAPEPGEVIVKVEATGLNFRDVMWAMGVLPEEALEAGFAGATLGLECAGTVVGRGEGVTGLEIGDRVISIGPACFSSHVAVPEAYALPLPNGIPVEAGASLPVAFFTSWYGLVHLGRLARDEYVLIHGGAGGVGLAAIQIAQSIGARIIATAGSETKRSLLRSLGVDHVLNSRSHDFEDDVRALTGGAGVHVVLNSLSGRAMERSLRLLRPFGRFVELGKQDYYANSSVGLRPLKDNISYFSADLDQLVAQAPDVAARLFEEVSARFQDGTFGALPIRAFDAGQAIDAFRAMQRAEHIGKIVTRPPDPAEVVDEEEMRLFTPDPERVFAIVGGGSGLGLALADRLVKRGPSSIALLGRRGQPTAEAEELMLKAATRGSEIRYYSCDVADRSDLARALTEIRRWRPIRDVVHSAMVIEDMRIADLTAETLDRTLAAKVQGTMNLDLETRQDDLRTFAVFSSMATLVGNHGQSAYVAANAFMEGLIRERRAAGLPGLAFGWGAISDAGYVTRNEDLAKLLKRMGGGVDFHARHAMRAVMKLIADDQQVTDDAVTWISPMAWRGVAQSLKLLSGPTHRTLWDLGQQAPGSVETDDLREMLLSLAPDDARGRMVEFLTREIARILRVPEKSIAANRPVAEFGVDSLMGVELGLAAQQALGDDIPLMAISEENTLTEIAQRMAEHIQGAGSAADGQFAAELPTATQDERAAWDDKAGSGLRAAE